MPIIYIKLPMKGGSGKSVNLQEISSIVEWGQDGQYTMFRMNDGNEYTCDGNYHDVMSGIHAIVAQSGLGFVEDLGLTMQAMANAVAGAASAASKLGSALPASAEEWPERDNVIMFKKSSTVEDTPSE